MAKSKSYTTFNINDTAWVFSPQKFHSLIEERKIKENSLTGRRISNAQIYNELTTRSLQLWYMTIFLQSIFPLFFVILFLIFLRIFKMEAKEFYLSYDDLTLPYLC